MWSLSLETVLHKLLHCESIPQAAGLHKLPQHRSLPMGYSPSGTGCSSMGPPQGCKPCQQTGSGVGSSLHGSTGPGKSLLQCRLPTGSQLPSDIHLLRHRVHSTGCRWISAPLWTSMGCRGTTCLTMVFIMSCEGRLSAPASRAPPLPPASLILVPEELFLSHCLTLFSLPFYHIFFLPLLKYVITEALAPSLTSLALISVESVLEPPGIGFIRHGGSFSQLLTESTTISPPLPKPCHANP